MLRRLCGTLCINMRILIFGGSSEGRVRTVRAFGGLCGSFLGLVLMAFFAGSCLVTSSKTSSSDTVESDASGTEDSGGGWEPAGDPPGHLENGIPSAGGNAEPWSGYDSPWVEPQGHNPGGGMGYGGYCATGTSKAYGGGPGIEPCLATGCPAGFSCVDTMPTCGNATATDCWGGCDAGTACLHGEGICAQLKCSQSLPCIGGQSMQCNVNANMCEFQPDADNPDPPPLVMGECEDVGCPVGMSCNVDGHCSCLAVYGGLIVGSRLVGKPCTSHSDCDVDGDKGAPTHCQPDGTGSGYCQVACNFLDKSDNYCMPFGGGFSNPWLCHDSGLCGAVQVSDSGCVSSGLGDFSRDGFHCGVNKGPDFGPWKKTSYRWKLSEHYSPIVEGEAPQECPIPKGVEGQWLQEPCSCFPTTGICTCQSHSFAADGAWRLEVCQWDDTWSNQPTICHCDEGSYEYLCNGVLKITSECKQKGTTKTYTFRIDEWGNSLLDGVPLAFTESWGCDTGCNMW